MRVLSVLALLVVTSGAVSADVILNYSLTTNTDTITFSIDTTTLSPQVGNCEFPGQSATNCFGISPMALTVDGKSITGLIGFFVSSAGGGLTVSQGVGAVYTLLVNNDGPVGNPQLFTGTLSSPTLNTYTNAQLVGVPNGSPVYNESFLLNTTVSTSSATPEPNAYGFVAVSLGCLVFARWRRKHRQA